MASHRDSDPPGAQTRYRSERIQEDGGKWYFSTREGTLEGPFEDRFQAVEALEKYISIQQLELLSPDSKLTLSD